MEETRFKHDQELLFKARNRGNKMFGLWVAEQLGLTGEAAASYAKDVVMADFEMPGDDDIFTKVKADLAAKSDRGQRSHPEEAAAGVPRARRPADQGRMSAR